MWPEHIQVRAGGFDGWYTLEDEWGGVYGAGSAEHVHSWLGQHSYHKTGSGTSIEGWYKRARVSSVVEGGRQA